MSRIRRLVASSLVLALATGIATAAVPDTFRLTATDQKIARAVVLRKADLADPAWKGGLVKPVLKSRSVPGDTLPEVVVTGAAASSFESYLGLVDTTVWVLRTTQMVQLDRQRLASVPALESVRSNYKDAPPALRLVSVRWIAGFPRVAPYTRAVRVVLDLTLKGKTMRMIEDWINLFKDRAEISLSVIADYRERNAVKAAEIKLAKLLVARATPPKVLGYTLELEQPLVLKAGSSYTFGRGLRLRLDKILGSGDTWVDNTGPAWVGLAPQSLSCTATLGGEPIAGTGKGGCRWQIPVTAAGQRFVVVAKAMLMGAQTTIDVPMLIE
jgi:hypothetical protein